MTKNGTIDPGEGHFTGMTFVELIALFMRKGRLFFLTFAATAALFAGGILLSSLLPQGREKSAWTVTAKAVVTDPYFAHAGELSASLATTGAAIALASENSGSNASRIDLNDVTAAYDPVSRNLTIVMKGKAEVDAREKVLALMAATRELLRKYGSERYEEIASRMEIGASSLSDPPEALHSKDSAKPYFEGLAQAIAARMEMESLMETGQNHEKSPEYPYDLLARDFERAKKTEMDAKARLEAYARESGIPIPEAIAEAENRSKEILQSKIALLREIMPALLVVFDVVDVKADEILVSTGTGVVMKLAMGFIAALFLAVAAVLVAGYVDRIKADPAAMNILSESRTRPSGGAKT